MTIYDIARLANVSPAAVSRVLNNKPGVSQIKREAIQKIIEENHFNVRRSKNISSSEIMNKKKIGILIDDPISEYQSTGVTLFQTELFETGYQTVYRCVDQRNNINDVLYDLHAMNVSAVVMMGYSFTNQKVISEAIQKYIRSVPTILVRQNSTMGLDNVYYVGINERKGITKCVDALVEHGRTKLALIMDRKLGEKSIFRYYFEQALLNYEGIKYYCYTDAEYSVEGGEKAADILYQEHPDIDGILCIRDKVAIGLVYGLQRKGLKIPEDVSVIGKDNSNLCEVSNPQLTSLDSMLYDCSLMGVHLLLDVLNNKITTHGLLLDSNLVIRGTL